MNRNFGIELEIANITQAQALAVLQACNINVRNAGYTHETTAFWKIVTDQSVTNGFEIVSPVLNGEAGLAEAARVCDALDAAGASVNNTCGFHVHFDAHDLSVDEIRTIVRRYAQHEATFDSFMPKSRRENTNRYCASLIRFVATQQFSSANTIEALATYQGSRYHKVNLQSYFRHGTIEFRQHSGTCNARKVVNWVRFLAAFIKQSITIANSSTETNAVPVIHNLPGMSARLLNALRSVDTGITVDDLHCIFGWKPATVTTQISRLRKLGFQITGNPTRGYSLVEQASAATEDTVFAGIPQEQVSFYRVRAAALAHAA